MSYFKLKVQQPQLAADYIRTNLEVLAKDIHPMDQIELHKQTGEMFYSALTDKVMLAQKLQNSLENRTTQLHLEKASSLVEDNRIKSLEEIIIVLGHDPKDAKGIKALIKKKEEDIAALRKQLKLPPSTHPQTVEVIQQKSEEDMMDLLLKLNERLNDIEQALEKALKEKQGELTSKPPEVIPIFSTVVPSTLGTSVATNVPAVTTEVITGTSTAGTTPSSSINMSTEELIKAMEELRLQVTELKQVKEQLAKAEKNYDICKISVVEKNREIKALEGKVKTLEQELTLISS